MIQLGLTRVQMLADIGAEASALEAQPLDPDDPAFFERELARLLVRAHHRNELFARLEPALRRRFSRVPSAQLEQDLLIPLRKAIGNCHRRGNHEDPTKWLTADVIATSRGAVLAISDEGAGFDVEEVVRRFERDERYFTREGHGIACFAETGSLVSYADGGRTWLMRFSSDPQPGKPLGLDEMAALGPVGDATFMQHFLAREVASFRERGVTLDSCRVYAVPSEPGASELAYVLRSEQEPNATVLTGRLLPAPAARADITVAAQLRAAGVGTSAGLRIPEPLGAFERPSLSLFRLDPSVTFGERVRKLSTLAPFALILRAIALGLAAIHMSAVSLETESFGAVVERQRNAKARVVARFSGRERERASACFEQLLARTSSLEPCAPVPIHGALEWDCIVSPGDAADERWELYRFDRSRRSHPGLDVGMFVADLLRFHVVREKGDPGLYEAGRAVFLESYFGARPPPWSRDVDWFVAGALLERLERMLRRDESKWGPKVAPLLDEIERTLARDSARPS
jgi:hypothetical protein